jgi:hypothetical protein
MKFFFHGHPQQLCHFVKVGDEFNYENKLK